MAVGSECSITIRTVSWWFSTFLHHGKRGEQPPSESAFKQQPGEAYHAFGRRLEVMLAVAHSSLASVLHKQRAAVLLAVAMLG